MNSPKIHQWVGILSIPLLILSTASTILATEIVDTQKISEPISLQNKFTYHVKIHPNGNGSLQQIKLSENIYQYSEDKNFQDLTMIDNLGKTLPFEIKSPNNKLTRHKRNILFYPLTTQRNLLENTDITSFKYDHENRLSEISSNKKNIHESKIVGYLLDLGENNIIKNSQFNFKLSKTASTSFLRFDVDQSKNLKHWSSVSKQEVLAQLSHEKMTSQINHINIVNINSRYLRIKLLDQSPPFLIESIIQEYTEKEIEPLVWSEVKTVPFNQVENGFVTSLSPALIYRMLKIDLPKTHSLLKGKLYSRKNNRSNWISRNNVNLFHLNDGDKNISNNLIALDDFYANQIKISLDYPISDSQSDPLKIKLAWLPHKLVFFANGNAPYELIVGKRHSSVITENPQSVLTMIKKQMNGELPIAILGDSKLIAMKQLIEIKKTNWKKFGLWLTLIIGVLLMAWMAKRLLKQLDE